MQEEEPLVPGLGGGLGQRCLLDAADRVLTHVCRVSSQTGPLGKPLGQLIHWVKMDRMWEGGATEDQETTWQNLVFVKTFIVRRIKYQH